MVDTPRSQADLLALWADNASGDISAQDGRDFIVSATPTGRSAFAVVAANGASDFIKFQADYVCDGTADDVQIQAALDAAAGIGDVVLTGGTFTIAATINPPSNSRLSGQGAANTTVVAVAGFTPGRMFFTSAKTDVTYSDMTIDGNAVATLTGVYVSSGSQDITIERNHITNFTEYGVRCKGSAAGDPAKRIRVQDNKFSLTTEHAIYFNHEGEYSIIARNFIDGTASSSANGIWCGNSSTHLVIADNIIDTPGDMGIEIWGGCDYATIHNNIIESPGNMGISLDSCDFATVSGNVVNASGGFGLELAGSTFCVLSGNTVSAPTTIGISVSNSDNFKNVINGNVVNNSGSYGIQLVNAAGPCVVTNNYVEESASRGIFLNGAGCVDVLVANNLVADCVGAGIYLFGGTDNMVHDNKLVNNSPNITINGGTGESVRNNRGFVTEADGTGSITSGGTTDVITHGLDRTPTIGDISVTLAENPTNTPGAIWVDTITSTQFTVNCENDPGASNLDFGWRAAML